MGKMFGTNGIRGIANTDMTCELALGMGRSVVRVLGKRIAVACDPRTSSQMLKDSVCSGIMSSGGNVFDLGMIPTPALQYWIKTRGDVDGGVMITASHNPPEYNGIKCIAEDGTECSKDQENDLEKAYREGAETVPWQSVGTRVSVNGAGEEYVDAIVSHVNADAIRSANLVAVVDCANGCACATTPMLMEKLGVKTIVINGEPDMLNPAHPSEPTEENLTELREEVRRLNADIGIAHDGDADRCVFVTSEGEYVPGDSALAVLGKYLLNRDGRGKIIVTVATSSVVEMAVKDFGGSVEYTAVGAPVVARKMISSNAIFGGEENGGLIFAEHQFCRDGAMGAAMMLECVAEIGKLSDSISALPKFFLVKKAVACPDATKETVSKVMAERHSDLKQDTTDGLKLLFEDGWVLLRASGTEEKYRIYSGSPSAETAERRSGEFVAEFNEIVAGTRRVSPSSA